jgi:hypothetical protein
MFRKSKKIVVLIITSVCISLACQFLTKPLAPTINTEKTVYPESTSEPAKELPPSQWLRFIGTERNDNLLNAATDKQGNIFTISQNVEESKHFGFTKFLVIGDNKVDPEQKIVLTKVNPDGKQEWEINLELGLSLPYQIAIDDNGDIYIAGLSMENWGTPIKPYHHGNTNFNSVYNGFVAKLDKDGKLQWNTFIERYELVSELLIATSPNDGVYIAGSAIEEGFLNFITYIRSDGSQEWVTDFGKNGLGAGVSNIQIDSEENIFLTGFTYTNWGFPVKEYNTSEDIVPLFVAKFDKTGNLLWNTFTASDGIREIIDIQVSGDGQVFLTGTSNSNFSYSTFDSIGMGLITKFNSNGDIAWKHNIDLCIGYYTSSVGKNIISTDGKNNVIFLTYKQNSYYATTINSDGQILQEATLDIPLDTILINGIKNETNNNNIYIFGEVYNDDTYDNFPWTNFEELNKPFGSKDYYLAQVLFTP